MDSPRRVPPHLHIFGFIGAFVGAALLSGLTGLIAGFSAGEAVSMGLTVVLMNRSLGEPAFANLGKFVDFLAVAAALLAGIVLLAPSAGGSNAVLWVMGLVGLGRVVLRRRWLISTVLDVVGSARSYGHLPAAGGHR